MEILFVSKKNTTICIIIMILEIEEEIRKKSKLQKSENKNVA